MIEIILILIAVIFSLIALLFWALTKSCVCVSPSGNPVTTKPADYVSMREKEQKEANYLDHQFDDSMPTVLLRDMQNV
jgi:hypothetical protein